MCGRDSHCLIQGCLENSLEVTRKLVGCGCECLWDGRVLSCTITLITLTSHVGTLTQYPSPSPPMWGPSLSTHHPHLPCGDPLSEFLIDHDSNRKDVCSSGLGRIKGWPEQLLQVLAELEELDLEEWEAVDRASVKTCLCTCVCTCTNVDMHSCVSCDVM